MKGGEERRKRRRKDLIPYLFIRTVVQRGILARGYGFVCLFYQPCILMLLILIYFTYLPTNILLTYLPTQPTTFYSACLTQRINVADSLFHKLSRKKEYFLRQGKDRV